MGFAAPIALWLLPLALLPLLALRRRHARRMPVATMHLWAAAAMRDAAPLARRVRRHWLALLQVAVAAAIALAIAGPLWPGHPAVAAIVTTIVAMVVALGAVLAARTPRIPVTFTPLGWTLDVRTALRHHRLCRR